MLLRNLALVVATLVFAGCAHSGGGLTPAPLEPSSVQEVTQSSAPVSEAPHWRFWRTATTGSGLASDAHRRIWFFSSNTSISTIAISGHVTTYTIPVAGADPVFGNDGNIWFSTESKIGRFSPTGPVSYFDATSGVFGPLTPGFGNDMWFTGFQTNQNGLPVPTLISHMTASGTVTQHQVAPDTACADVGCALFGITRGPGDGNIWFSGKTIFVQFGGVLGNINPVTGAMTVQGEFVGLYGNLVVGPDERLWNLGLEPGPNGNEAHVVAYNTNFTLSKDYLLPTGGTGLVAGHDALYVINGTGGAIVRVLTSGQMTTFALPGQIPCCINSIIATGPHDDIWFSTQNGIGVLKPIR